MPAPITTTQELQNSTILGLGVYRPSRQVSNDEICQHVDSTDEWIRIRSGIRSRHFADPDDSVITMATAAGRDALRTAAVSADQIGAVIVATSTFPYQTPAAGPQIAHQLGINASAFDVSAGCTGFCLALALASDLVRARTATHVLVIGVERLSEFLDPTDRSTAFIFSDGAGAVVVGPSDQPGMGPVEWGSDGSQADALTQHPSLTHFRDNPTGPPPTVRMDGHAIFRWAVSEMDKVARAALDRAGVPVERLDAFIPHQANLRITEALAKRLALSPGTVIARDIVDAGNTSAASVPLAMHTLLHTGQAHGGDTALLIGFGAGLTYAAQVVTLPDIPRQP